MAGRMGLLVMASALTAGVGELALRFVASRVLSDPVAINPASVWLAPISALAIFGPVTVLAWLLGRAKGRGAAWAAAVAAAAFLTTFDLLMLAPRLHAFALAVLSTGVASQVTWGARRWPRLFARVLRVTVATLLAVSVGGAMVTARPTSALQLTADDTPADAPSVVLLVLDTVRALELSAYGYDRSTSPRLAALAREGVRFDRAVATAPWTLPSHATLFTGRFQRDLSVGWSSPLDSAAPTLAEHFSALGYATGGFVANLHYCSREFGLARGFQTYRDYALVGTQVIGSTMLGRRAVAFYNSLFARYLLVGRKDARRVVNEFLDWQGKQGRRPYFAFLNFFDAHEPYAPDAPYDLRFAATEPATRQLVLGRRHSAAEVQGLRDAYDGAIASLDAQLGRLFDELSRRDALERTIIVVTADHGEEFAEHGYMSHGNGLNFPALHVPLMLRWPKGGVPANFTVAAPVSLADVAATIIDLTNSRAKSLLPGTSLAPLWRGESLDQRSPILSELYWVRNQPDWYPVSAGNMRSLVRGRYHYIAGPAKGEALYDIVGDPYEQHDLLGAAALRDTLAAMRRMMTAFPDQDRRGR